ncbi:4075_t:CDS:10 [Diversispora eburnea]|uniref:4075_t:CDS:1 n=1 Tax=Diversispora eburnea TaxID=1213867 RepID=A0A9N9AR68_9GLOM|nr:4075_t:CDS:10 [Diversispora eburnea]
MALNLLEILSKDYKTLLETGDFADIVIQVGEGPQARTWFKAHSLVLKARSPYFRNKLATDCSNVVAFNEPNISPKLFSVLLMYIYLGTIELEAYSAPEIMYLLCGARELCLRELVDFIQDYLIEKKDLIKRHFFFVARASYNHFEKLSMHCNNILKEDPATFINSQDFITIKKNELLSFYKNHPTNIREIILWEKLVEWGVAQFPSMTLDLTTWTDEDFESLRELMDPFISYIDFHKVTRSEFLKNIRPFKKLFDDSFYIEILEYHTFPELTSESLTPEVLSSPRNGNCCNKKSYSKPIRNSGDSFRVKEYEVYQQRMNFNHFIRDGDFVFCEYEKLESIAKECDLDIVHKEKILEGYQLYIVEQWVCDKKVRFYNTVTVFTGVPSHRITVCSIHIKKLEIYPFKIEQMFKMLEEDNTRQKVTDIGLIFVTNLSTFPSSLNIILVPDGDYKKHYLEFYLNSNLRKIGCSGRSALSLKPPTDAQKDKFYQLYSISEMAPFEVAVLELVKLVQISLYIFDKFPISFVDGLLCDSTENALREFNREYKSITFRDNILEPVLVAEILKIIVNIRNELHSLNYQVGKDPFSDPESFLNGIAAFQKSVKINITRKLDKPTIEKIHFYYDRQRYPDGLKVLKSKIEDISGISATDIETSSLEKFWKNVNIDSLRYLWKGKKESSQQLNDSDWFQGGKELGKSFLRGAKTGEVLKGSVGYIRGVTGSLSRSGSPVEKIFNPPAKTPSLPPYIFRNRTSRKRPEIVSRRSRRRLKRFRLSRPNEAQIGFSIENLIQTENAIQTENEGRNEDNINCSSEDESDELPFDNRIRRMRSHSMSSFYAKQKKKQQKQLQHKITRSNSFNNLDTAKEQNSKEQREKSLREIVKSLEVQILESKMPQSARSVQAFYNLWNFIYDQWRRFYYYYYYKKSEEDDE